MDRQTTELLGLLAGWMLLGQEVLDRLGPPAEDVQVHFQTVDGRAPITVAEWLCASQALIQQHIGREMH